MTGTEGAWVPYVLAAVSAGTQYMGAKEEAADKRALMNRSLQQSSETADKTANEVVKEGGKFSPEERMQAMRAQEAEAFAQAQKDAAGSGIVQTAGENGNTSSTFKDAKAAADASEGNRVTALAQEISKTRAPGRLVNEEGLRRGALAGELSNQWSTTRNMVNANNIAAQNVGPSDLSTFGALAGALGSAYGAGSGAPAGEGGYATIGDASNDASLYTMPGKKDPGATRWAGNSRFSRGA